MENKEQISNVENVVIIGSGPAGYTVCNICSKGKSSTSFSDRI